MPLSAFDHPLALIAPSLMESFLFGIIRLGSTLRKMPSPVQVGHAPKGLLNENIRGDNSSIQAPCSGHAKFCENSNSSPPITSTMTIFVKLGFRANLFDSYVLDVRENNTKPAHKTKDLTKLIGCVGVSKSILRPTGRIEIDGEIYDAMARAEFIEKEKVISVIDVKDGHIIVKEM